MLGKTTRALSVIRERRFLWKANTFEKFLITRAGRNIEFQVAEYLSCDSARDGLQQHPNGFPGIKKEITDTLFVHVGYTIYNPYKTMTAVRLKHNVPTTSPPEMPPAVSYFSSGDL